MCVVDAQSFCPSSFTVVCMLLLGVILFCFEVWIRFGYICGCVHTLWLSGPGMYGWVVGVFVLFGVVELDSAMFVGVCTSLVVRPGTAVWSVAGRHAIVCRLDYM